jgi:hypothetical protein
VVADEPGAEHRGLDRQPLVDLDAAELGERGGERGLGSGDDMVRERERRRIEPRNRLSEHEKVRKPDFAHVLKISIFLKL